MITNIIIFNLVLIITLIITKYCLKNVSFSNLTKLLFIEFWCCVISYGYLFANMYPYSNKEYYSEIICAIFAGIFLTTNYLVIKKTNKKKND